MNELRDLLFTPRCLGCNIFGCHLCAGCAKSLEPRTSHHLPQVDRLVTVADYGGWIRETLILYKSGHRQYRNGQGEVLQLGFEAMDLTKDYKVIPIPTSRSKRTVRGYDTISDLLKNSRIPSSKIDFNGLQLKVGIEDQVGLSAIDRRRNLRNAFRALEPLAGTVILVDDIVTTGSTLSEAALAARIAGANPVFALAICGSKNWR